MNSYADDADLFVSRIVALIPTHPEIMEMSYPWDLLKIDGLYLKDLQLSLFQASWALAKAKRIYKDKTP